MRNLKNLQGTHFKMVHLKHNQHEPSVNGARMVDKCRLRAALPDDVFETDSDLYLTYTDLDDDLPRMCFKALVRRVAFPPEFEWLTIEHFENE